MSVLHLIVIFWYMVLGNAWKPLPIFYVFQENKTRWRRRCGGKTWLACLKIRALTPTNLAFLLYYLIVIIYSERAIGSVGTHQGWQYTWPGFEPQVSRFLNNIFPIIFPCSTNIQGASYTFLINQPRVSGNQIKGWEWRTPYTMVKRMCTLSGKSQKRPILMGQITELHLHLGTDTPKVCNILLFFLSFHYFYPF